MQHPQQQIPQQASLKPRSIITLPHLIGRQKPVSPKSQALSSQQQQQQYALTKAPIIIRERLDPNAVTTALPQNTQSSTPPAVSYTSTDLTTATTTQTNSRSSSSP